jgi:RNA polymerase sigma factor (sigma-70 family)
MATSRITEVVRRLRQAVQRRDGAGATDGQLLEAFVGQRDGAALGVLVRRHGPMVWAVCRRVLDNHHDAEDAFQATFLVLVRKAASVLPREQVANWLYGVAYQTARKARATTARRRARERPMMDLPEPEAVVQAVTHELRPILDQELSRLPDKYRAALVLCDLQGTTRREAARQLGVPEGTLSGRLTRGRALLAKRLVRRGLGVASVAATLSERCASAGVPAALVSSTIRASTLLATGQAASAGAIPAQVTALMKGVLRTMFLKRIKSVALLLAVLLTVAGIGLLAQAAMTTGPAVASVSDQSKAQEGGSTKPATPPALALKEVTLDAVDSAAGTVNVTVGKAVVPDEIELLLDKGDGTVVKVKAKIQGLVVSKKLPRLLDLPVAKDATIKSGDKALKLADLQPGTHASLELAVRDNQLTVISISVKK